MNVQRRVFRLMAKSYSRSLVIPNSGSVSVALRPDLDEATHYARAEKAQATRRAYRSDFEIFRAWCDTRGALPLPASSNSVGAFLASEAKRGVRPSTLSRRLAAILYAHKLAGHASPTASEAVKATLRGIKRTKWSATNRKTPATADKISAMAAATGEGARGVRDRALLLLGFAGAFRRSELVALDANDVQFCDGGLRVSIRKSKTDQEGEGATIAIVPGSFACPVKATREWLNMARIKTGPIFRPISKAGRVLNRRLSDRTVAEVVKTAARRIGLKAKDFSGHSLRSGFLTSAARRGASIFKMMDVSRHKSVDTLRRHRVMRLAVMRNGAKPSRICNKTHSRIFVPADTAMGASQNSATNYRQAMTPWTDPRRL
jgi:site-specific recombinase XerD